MSDPEITPPDPQHTKARPFNRPLGISVLALLLFLFGGIALLASILPAPPDTAAIPWFAYVLLGLYCLGVGWGLWGLKRWAYMTALLGSMVQIFFAFRTALILQRNALVPFLLAIALIVYLLQPRIRSIFIQPSGQTES